MERRTTAQGSRQRRRQADRTTSRTSRLSRTKPGSVRVARSRSAPKGTALVLVHAAGPVGEQSEVVAEQESLVHIVGDKHGGGGPFPHQGAYPLVQL